MIKIKRTFLRSFGISLTVALCLITGVAGISAAYENTRRIGFGEYTKAVEIHDGKIKILDFEIDLLKR